MIAFQHDKTPEWNECIQSIPGASAHIFQSTQWGAFKQDYGWKAQRFIWQDEQENILAAAQMLTRQVSLLGARFVVAYCPKGPVVDWENIDLVSQVLDDLQDFAKRAGAIFIKIDTDVVLGWGVPGDEQAQESEVGAQIIANLLARGWQFSQDQIQFRNTVLIDLRNDEADLLAAMKQKTRYNIRLAERKGVQVRVGNNDDLAQLYHMYAETSVRDGFVIRSQEYYTQLWSDFMSASMAAPLIAEVDGEAIAAVFVFHFNGYAIYLHGMSTEIAREKMPNYLLQWQAMLYAKAQGCHTYDMWGAPDDFNESDSLWGVYRFKDGFAGTVLRTLGAWDYPARPFLYKLYTTVLPRVLNVMRRRGKIQTESGL